MSETRELHVVLGAGPLGLATARALTEMGKRVRIVNRRGTLDPVLAPAGAQPHAADLYDPAAVAHAAAGAVALYQCAQPSYTRWPQEFPPLQAAILEGAARAGAKVILGDNLYMYGRTHGQPMREDSPINPVGKKGVTRAQMAEAALTAHKAGSVRVAIVRGSDFYGRGVMGSLFGERTFPAILAGKAGEAVGNPDLPHSITYIDDFGRALANVGTADDALGQVWHAPNAPTGTQRQFLHEAFELAGKPAKVAVMGRFMLMLGGLFIPAAREVIETLYQFTDPFVVDDSKYTRRFGHHATAYRDGLRATLDWYAKHFAAGAHA
jgi:nucleoside-diphosphate-sugar epimerase